MVSSERRREIENRTTILEEAMKYTKQELDELKKTINAGFADVRTDMRSMQTWFETHSTKFATKNELELHKKEVDERLDKITEVAQSKTIQNIWQSVLTIIGTAAITGLVAYFIQSR